MTVARSMELLSRPSSSSGSAERSGNAARGVLLVAIAALVLAMLGPAAHVWGSIDGYPDTTQQWTD